MPKIRAKPSNAVSSRVSQSDFKFVADISWMNGWMDVIYHLQPLGIHCRQYTRRLPGILSIILKLCQLTNFSRVRIHVFQLKIPNTFFFTSIAHFQV